MGLLALRYLEHAGFHLLAMLFGLLRHLLLRKLTLQFEFRHLQFALKLEFKQGHFFVELKFLLGLNHLSLRLLVLRLNIGLHLHGFDLGLALVRLLIQLRLLLAKLFTRPTNLLILDEPTAGVDVELRQTLWDFIGRLNREGHTVVLTTHYLEEAQALCNRIAMLKAGQVVALDSTAALIRRISGSQLVVKLASGRLPESLHALVSHPNELAGGNQYTLRVNHHNEVENILAALRQSGATLEDLQLNQADLEDVFLDVMGQDTPAAGVTA